MCGKTGFFGLATKGASGVRGFFPQYARGPTPGGQVPPGVQLWNPSSPKKNRSRVTANFLKSGGGYS